MFTYAKLILLFLQFANSLVSWGKQAQEFKEAEDAAIGRAALRVLEATSWGKDISERVHALDDDDLDHLERELERGV